MLVLMAGLSLAVSPARADVMAGSVKIPAGSTIDRLNYVQGGCTQDSRDGNFGAYIDIRKYRRTVKVIVRKTDVLPPASTPSLSLSLYPGCDPAQSFTSVCNTSGSCTLPIRGERFAQVAINFSGQEVPYASVHFTIEAI
jgi:hypothetical protein